MDFDNKNSFSPLGKSARASGLPPPPLERRNRLAVPKYGPLGDTKANLSGSLWVHSLWVTGSGALLQSRDNNFTSTTRGLSTERSPFSHTLWGKTRTKL